jgi:hypothetical protein
VLSGTQFLNLKKKISNLVYVWSPWVPHCTFTHLLVMNKSASTWDF